jgi:ketosteroid isomerase-like protein
VTEAAHPDRQPRDVVEQFLRAALDLASGELADLYAPEVELEMPFALPPYPRRAVIGREDLRARFRAGSATRRYLKVDAVVIHETADPEVVVVEYDLHGEALATSTPFVLSNAMVMTIRDGLIVHSRDYSDPIAAARALGALPQLVQTLTRDAAP